jgi:RNA polymerase sigma-70 factor (ECF subfamily)
MIRLADQDRTQWDRLPVTEGHTLVRACLRRNQPGPFQIQAAIAAVHAHAATAAATDWSQIVALYDQLYAVRPHAVTALNRAVAIGEMRGAAAGLDALDSLDATPLEDYQPYHARTSSASRMRRSTTGRGPGSYTPTPTFPPGIEDARHDVAA